MFGLFVYLSLLNKFLQILHIKRFCCRTFEDVGFSKSCAFGRLLPFLSYFCRSDNISAPGVTVLCFMFGISTASPATKVNFVFTMKWQAISSSTLNYCLSYDQDILAS